MLLKVVAAGTIFTATIAAQPQPQHSQPGWPCVPGRTVDPAYLEVAERTGGQVFLFDRSEAGRSLVLMRETHKHEEAIYRATGKLPGGYRDFQFPVDTTVESLLLSASLHSFQAISTYRPS